VLGRLNEPGRRSDPQRTERRWGGVVCRRRRHRVGIRVDHGMVGTDGLIIAPGIREQFGEVLELLTEPQGRVAAIYQ
jgi:hypothetical protein